MSFREHVLTGFDISVVMACYTEERLASIDAAMASLQRQKLEPKAVIIAVDNNEGLALTLQSKFDWATVVLNRSQPGASSTRNRGAQAVASEYIAFLDDDETADPDWLLELTLPFAEPDVVGTGGNYHAKWSTGKPVWFPDEFAWVVGGSYLGLPTVTAQVRNVWSGNMAVRTEVFRRVGGFRPGFGKRACTSQPEDTDLCIRMTSASEGRWIYVPTATINHTVPASRASMRFFISRCFAEGLGKADMTRRLEMASVIEPERVYAHRTARAALRRLRTLRPMQTVQGLVMMVALASTGSGYLISRMRSGSPAAGTATELQDTMKPALIVDYEISTPLQSFIDKLPDRRDYRQVWVLVRACGKPVRIVEAAASDGAMAAALRYALANDLSAAITEIAGANPTAAEQLRSGLGLPSAEFRVERTDKVPESTPPLSVTVAICTRERPVELARALDYLALQRHQEFTMVIVDNAPTSQATHEVVERYKARFRDLRYLVEPTPGLSRARNCALARISTELVVFLDDDETADQDWLSQILSTFLSHPDAAAVTGSVVPAELETRPQWWFEQYGGHSKGRDFTRFVFRDGETGNQSPVYPLPPFGWGGNMAFRTKVVAEMGGFDTGLGAGTFGRGCEETLMFSQLLLTKQTLIYEPAAMVRHFHYRTLDGLKRQMYGYGVALTAYYAALVRWNWRLIIPLLGLLPRAIGDVAGRWQSSGVTAAVPNDFPARLLCLKRRGMLIGPLAYWRARWVAHRTDSRI